MVMRSIRARGNGRASSIAAARPIGIASSTRSAASVNGGNWPTSTLFSRIELAKLALVASSSSHWPALIGRLGIRRSVVAASAALPRAVECGVARFAAFGDVALERLDVGRHPVEALRAGLEVLETGRPRRLLADRLADRVGELGRLRRLEADHRHARLAPVLRDEDAVSGVRVDRDAVARTGVPDRRQPVRVA